jgi:F-type H+-transporting ATPase subunit k
MVAMYTVAGRQVGSHVLAMATLGTTFALVALAKSGKKTQTTPPIQASSSDEENFIKEFLVKAELESKANH